MCNYCSSQANKVFTTGGYYFDQIYSMQGGKQRCQWLVLGAIMVKLLLHFASHMLCSSPEYICRSSGEIQNTYKNIEYVSHVSLH